MGRLVAALALVLTLVGSAIAAPAMPWTTFSEMSRDVSQAGQIECGFVVLARTGDSAYYVFVNPEGTRIVVWYDAKPQDPAAPIAEVASATLDSKNNDVIPPLRWRPFVVGADENPCSALLAWDVRGPMQVRN